MAAVERVEVNLDGGSALYGSDAIGGVINVILKQDYEGLEFQGRIGSPTEEGGDEKSGSIVSGITGEKGALMMVYEHDVKDGSTTRIATTWPVKVPLPPACMAATSRASMPPPARQLPVPWKASTVPIPAPASYRSVAPVASTLPRSPPRPLPAPGTPSTSTAAITSMTASTSFPS